MIKDSIFLKFKNVLPAKPYVSNDLNAGLKITSKQHSFNCKYIQPNTPFNKSVMVFDIDSPASATYFIDKHIPTPNFMVLNKENGRSHYFYMLEKGVYFTNNSSKKAQNYYTNIYKSLCYQMGADVNYCGLIAKNPLSNYWKTIELTDHLYSLDELSKYCDFDNYNKTDPERYNKGIGRNCTLFDCLRYFAYAEIRKLNYNYKAFWNSCKSFAIEANKRFSIPLSFNEVMQIVKSVVNWCMDKFSRAAFIQYQKNANKRSQIVRKEKAEAKIKECRALYSAGHTVKEICLIINISKSACYNYLP